MLSTLLSLPSLALTSTGSFLANRRRGLTYAAGAVGAAYLGGRWAIQKIGEQAERGRRDGWGREDLNRRFESALADAQFTTLALLPTLDAQVRMEMDVEGRTAELGRRAREEKRRRAEEAEKEEREEEARREKAREEEEERLRAEREVQEVQEKEQPEPDASAPHTAASKLDPTARPFSLNPSAPSFSPGASFAPSPASISPTDADGDVRENGAEQKDDGDEKETKSWAAVAAAAPALDAEAVVAANGVTLVNPSIDSSAPPATDGSTQPPSLATANGEANGETAAAEPETVQAAEEQPQAEEEGSHGLREKTKAELWGEIKVLSFTRLLTTLYLLTLLTLQTHVQLSLLGRSSYIDSLLSALPPRSPSPPRARDKSLPDLAAENGDADDLERTLYEAKRLPLSLAEQAEKEKEERERRRKDLERKYLTFSWWLLHEGWRVVETRCRRAVEGVVGPMGLKSPLVYGEIGALFGELRRRVEVDAETGRAFDFSPALHPPTAAEELQTLISGGSYTPPPPSSSSSSSSSSSYPPPRPQPQRHEDPISPALRSLLSETADALDSPDASLLRGLALDALFALVLEKLEPAFTGVPGPGGEGVEGEGRGARFEDVTERTARLAGMLPALTRLTGEVEGAVLATAYEGSEWVEAITSLPLFRDFCAVLYGSWDRDDPRASCAV
ncbi:peroxin [Rhodosporidiobolus nylandii]